MRPHWRRRNGKRNTPLSDLGVSLLRGLNAAAKQPERWAIAIAAVLLGCLSSWRVQLEPGIVGLVHDWSIMPFPEQHVALARQIFDGWYSFGFGAPVVFVTNYFEHFVFAGLAAFGADGRFLSKAFVFAIAPCAMIGMTALLRALGMSPVGALFGGIFYAADPVMLNKLVSGQTSYVIGYALLPVSVRVFLDGVRRGRIIAGGLATGALIALVAGQIQLGIVAAGLVALAALTLRRGSPARRFGIVAIAFVTAAVIHAPTMLGIFVGFGAFSAAGQFAPSVVWLSANSLDWTNSVRLIGYLTHYDAKAVGDYEGLWNAASWIAVGIVVAGFIVLRRELRAFVFIPLALTLVAVSGNKSLLQHQVEWLFTFQPLQIFRELYHLMAVPSLCYAVGIAAFWTLAGPVLWRFSWPGRGAAALLLAALGVYLSPMLVGDAGGWLTTFTYDRDLAPARELAAGNGGRIVWFPMDQPLSFDERGSGVDPMSVTGRGSFWWYSLSWPMTALDMTARRGTAVTLRRELQALCISTVFNRERFASQLPGFTLDPASASRVFDQPLDFSDRLPAERALTPTLFAYAVDGCPGAARTATAAVVAPSRLSEIAAAAVAGYVPFAFGQVRPQALPYAVVRDAEDEPFEALANAGRALPLVSPNINARNSFARLDVWWWRRPWYADAPGAILGLNKQEFDVVLDRELTVTKVVIGYVASPVGGRIRVSLGPAEAYADTAGPDGAWRSAEFTFGPSRPGMRLAVQSIDDGAEVALRSIDAVSAAEYDAALRTYRALLAGAVTVSEVSPPDEAVVRHLAAGRAQGPVGVMVPGRRYRLTADVVGTSDAAEGRLVGALNWILAAHALQRGRSHLVLETNGTNEPVSFLVTDARIVRWAFDEIRPAAAVAGLPPAPPGRAAVLWDANAFNQAWTVAGSTSHFATSLGTNAFMKPGATVGEPVVYRYRDAFHWLFAIGAALTLLGVVCSLPSLTFFGAAARLWTVRRRADAL